MNTQRLEGHTPTPYKYYNNGKGRDRIEDANGDIVCEQVGHLDGPFIVHACNNIERLEKVNEALVKVAQNFIRIYRGQVRAEMSLEDLKHWLDKASEAIALAKEPA